MCGYFLRMNCLINNICLILFIFFLETRTANPRNEVIPEFQIADISDELETCWRQLGPRLKITAAKIKNIDEENKDDWTKANNLLILWKQQEGCNATVGNLADVLEKIGRKRIAEKLLGKLLITLSIYTESTYYRTVLVRLLYIMLAFFRAL